MSKSSSKSEPKPVADRIGQITQEWFLTEPLLFGLWTMHRVQSHPHIETIRVGRGMIEYNEAFLQSLDDTMLREVMRFEAIRIAMKHPYERRMPSPKIAWEASNLAIRECTSTRLAMPSANERFGTDKHDRMFFEYYYNLLSPSNTSARTRAKPSVAKVKQPSSKPRNPSPSSEPDEASTDMAGDCAVNPQHERGLQGEGRNCPHGRPAELSEYCESELQGTINASSWDEDNWIAAHINDVIQDIQSSQNWGTIPGAAQELILATLTPKLDYRRVLSAFRASLLSTRRTLTRMKPSRRYGSEYLGSRRDFSTKLLVAIDVSGSVSSDDVRNACSIINRFFKYGIETIDVVYFDTKIRTDEPITMKRAIRAFSVQGRGGTNFQPIIDYVDAHRDYDGLVVFTDGIAPTPQPPKRNRRTRIAWLFNSEEQWREQREHLITGSMVSAYVHVGHERGSG